jgi:predicted transport protein
VNRKASPTHGNVRRPEKKLGHPAVPQDALRRSLARILDASAPSSPPQAGKKAAPAPAKPPVGPVEPPKGQEYDLEHHLGNKSTLIRELWEEVDKHAMSLAPDVSRRIRKHYVGYFRGKRSFITTEIQQRRVLVYLALTVEAAKPWTESVMRDASNIGHFGMGDIEYSLVTIDQLDELRTLISAAYAAR